jgi:hypothetical protein
LDSIGIIALGSRQRQAYTQGKSALQYFLSGMISALFSLRGCSTPCDFRKGRDFPIKMRLSETPFCIIFNEEWLQREPPPVSFESLCASNFFDGGG